jgi:formylglycine-generating enzyme required for sulfatase activity
MKLYATTRKSVLLTALISILLFPACVSHHTLIREPLNLQDGFPASYTDPYTGAEFILLPSGSFTMGSPENEAGRDADEGPMHTVSLDEFYIGKYEITQAQWEIVMGNNPSRFKGHANLPVDNGSWNDVQKFLKRLNKKTGLSYRLPTEAEWEYACRGGTQTPFYSGSDSKKLNEYAWFYLNSGEESRTVGTRMPNAWGLYDMHGNISEWIGDGRRGYLSKAEHNPRGVFSGEKATHRGGCWLYPAKLCRSANRMSVRKDFRTQIIGFRLAIDKDAVHPKPK